MSVRKINPPSRASQPTEIPTEDQFKQMGEQLTAQYRKVEALMPEILRFGAMLMQIKTTLSAVDTVSSRGKPLTGNGIKGEGLKAWLEAYAPDIKRSTAYRYMGVAEAVATEYKEIVGTRVASKYSLPELVTAETLPKQAQAKQLELFDYISGTSQRSWLDRFSNEKPASAPKGGSRQGAGRPSRSFDEREAMSREHWNGIYAGIVEGLNKKDLDPLLLKKEELENLDGVLLDLRKHLKEALNAG